MQRTIEDVMTRTVVVARDDDPYKELVRLMREYRVSALPVVDEERHLVGIVSESDLILKEDPFLEGESHALEGRKHRADRERAAAQMASGLKTRTVATARPGDMLGEAARKMHRLGVNHLPVLDDDNRVVGIVSRADLLKVFLRPDEDIRGEVTDEVLAHTLFVEPGAVRATVRDGVVTLEGQVERRSLVPALIGLVHAVDGVVGVDPRITFEVDDVTSSAGVAYPWAAYAGGLARR